MKKLWNDLRAYIRLTANISEQVDTVAAAESIRRNIYFKGPNVWILAFSIVIASVGLNVNSTAVIIGAMLISPLMGPIIGTGLGLGINDTRLLGESLRNLLVMVVISLIASTLYFLVSPLNLVNPTELEARTSPSIYDVMIALFGGFAGILEQARKEKGTVLSGVAIATALMPPLCTAGYGLAKFSGHFFFGAMGLFLINAIFITLATYLAAKYLKFKSFDFEDEAAGLRTRRAVSAVVVLVMVPSIWSAAIMIRGNNFASSVEAFISENRVVGRAYIYDYKVSTGRNRSVTLYTTGEELDTEAQLALVGAASKYGIPAQRIKLVENGLASKGNDSEKLVQGLYDRMETILQKKDSVIRALQAEVDASGLEGLPYNQLAREASALYPEIDELFVSRGARVSTDSLSTTLGTLIVARTSAPVTPAREREIASWLRIRLNDDSVQLRLEN
ncbi:MAG: DUF389 domain-containing protein [Bacteroidales bacterium]|nr:DUF389 domain-containing protein [Bacteroidales bacterium]